MKAFPQLSMKQTEGSVELVLLLKTKVSAPDDDKQPLMETKVQTKFEKRITYESNVSDADMANKMEPNRMMEIDRLEEDQAIRVLAGKRLTSKDESRLEALSPDEALSRVRRLVNRVKGNVLSIEYDEPAGPPKLLSAEIPAGQYNFFCEKLQQLGTLHVPPLAIVAKDAERIKIQIRLIMP